MVPVVGFTSILGFEGVMVSVPPGFMPESGWKITMLPVPDWPPFPLPPEPPSAPSLDEHAIAVVMTRIPLARPETERRPNIEPNLTDLLALTTERRALRAI
jgi:hypothetical protein